MTEINGKQSKQNTNDHDWDTYWDAVGTGSEGNPGFHFRKNLIFRLLGNIPSRSTLVDLGCGMGEFLIEAKRHFPEIKAIGLESSEVGVLHAISLARSENVDITYLQANLLESGFLEGEASFKADFAVCSEVLEHVDHPEVLLRNARALFAPGANLVITVPGGPRSAFDRAIGHRRHFSSSSLREVIEAAGLEVKTIQTAGFPFFNIYKIAVIARGKKLIDDVDKSGREASMGVLTRFAIAFFEKVLPLSLPNFPFGWQMTAIAVEPKGKPTP